jgi:RimJ/RimL family protein N-acetyltransferase
MMLLKELDKQTFENCLSGERLELIKPNGSFAEPLWQSILRDRASRGSSWEWLQNKEQLKDYLIKKEDDFDKIINILYLIKIGEEIIGTFYLHSLNYKDHKVEIGSGIEKAYEGKGYIRESMRLAEKELIRHGFNKIVIICDKNNIRSINFAEKNEFKLEGTFVQDYIENGQYVDSLSFGKILRD